jgi:hypothetical protein
MSSNPVERGGGAARWRSLLGRRSITAHIARLYALSAAVLLAIIVGLLQWVEARSLQGKDAYLLTDKVQQLRMMLHQHTVLEQEVEVEGGVYASDLHYHVYSRVLDDRGNVLTETPGMAGTISTTQGRTRHGTGSQSDQGRRCALVHAGFGLG